MNSEDRALLRQLLTEQRVLALSVIVGGEPVIGLLPFATTADFSAAIVHASRLARHAAGLRPNAPYSALIHRPDAGHANADPLQVPRVMLAGRVRPLAHDDAAYADARARYVSKFPQSEPIFALPDFTLHALQIENGRLVGGFARAVNFTSSALSNL